MMPKYFGHYQSFVNLNKKNETHIYEYAPWLFGNAEAMEAYRRYRNCYLALVDCTDWKFTGIQSSYHPIDVAKLAGCPTNSKELLWAYYLAYIHLNELKLIQQYDYRYKSQEQFLYNYPEFCHKEANEIVALWKEANLTYIWLQHFGMNQYNINIVVPVVTKFVEGLYVAHIPGINTRGIKTRMRIYHRERGIPYKAKIIVEPAPPTQTITDIVNETLIAGKGKEQQVLPPPPVTTARHQSTARPQTLQQQQQLKVQQLLKQQQLQKKIEDDNASIESQDIDNDISPQFFAGHKRKIDDSKKTTTVSTAKPVKISKSLLAESVGLANYLFTALMEERTSASATTHN